MGQKRVSVVDLSQEETTKKVSQKRARKETGRTVKTGKRAGRLADMGEPLEGVKFEEPELTRDVSGLTADVAGAETPQPARERRHHEHGRRYKYARSLVDQTQGYTAEGAIELVKKTSIARFDGTVSVHLNLTEAGLTADVPFPHPTGKKIRVAIASDDLLKSIEAKKKIDFDILLSTPEMMKRLVKVARILGPLGLMPSPKSGTISNDPEKRKKELESGTTQVRSESKAPLMHVVIGKASLDTKKIAKNLEALVSAIGPGHITKLTLASTMSPGVKVDLTVFQKPS